MKHVVILGGGYGGLRVAQRLLDAGLPEDARVTLIDRLPYHTFKTEFHALAAGSVSETHIKHEFPVHPQFFVLHGEIAEIDLQNRKIKLEKEEVPYGQLVVGLGCEDKYHGVPGAEEHSHSLQSIAKARKAFEALNELNPGSKVGIVGAGLTGIELASELKECRPDLAITLFDRGDSVLSGFPEKIQKYAEQWFLARGIEIVHRSKIAKVEPSGVWNGEEKVELNAVVWAAGVQPSKVVRALDAEKDAQGRVKLNEFHQIPGYEDAYVVGDCASVPLPPSAQAAEKQGEQIAQIILANLEGKEPKPLPPIKVKGALGSLGKRDGFGMVKGAALTGFAPRFAKAGVLWLHQWK